jgi:hypothetical protein
MDKTIYAETTLMYRPIHNDELLQFRKFKHIRRKKRRNYAYDYRKKLFSSNFRPLIMLANGIQTCVKKGSRSEDMFWNSKDLLYSPGNNYYFDTPEEAERVFKIAYPNYLKTNWYERTAQYRIQNNDNDESTMNEFTIVK